MSENQSLGLQDLYWFALRASLQRRRFAPYSTEGGRPPSNQGPRAITIGRGFGASKKFRHLPRSPQLPVKPPACRLAPSRTLESSWGLRVSQPVGSSGFRALCTKTGRRPFTSIGWLCL